MKHDTHTGQLDSSDELNNVSNTCLTDVQLNTTTDELDKILNNLGVSNLPGHPGVSEVDPTSIAYVKAAIQAKYIAKADVKAAVLEARIDEAGGVQLVYGNYMAQTHAGGKWQKLTDRREDLQDELATLRKETQEEL